MSRDLTPKQNKFIDGVVSGLTYSEAYRQAYNAKNMSAETIAVKASVMASKDNIRVIIDQRKKQLADKAIWDREKALSMLAEVATTAQKYLEMGNKFDAATANSMTKAIEQANKMCGYNEPEKKELSGNLDIKVELTDD